MNNQSQQAYAGGYVGGGDRGTGLTMVSFRVTPISRYLNDSGYVVNPTSWILLTRMWSDGTVEMNLVGDETIPVGDIQGEYFTGWVTVTDSVAGYACVGDTDGNRSVDITDMLAVLDNWGECEQDPPLGLPDDPDLM